ncbi:MAG: succinyl-diaminopimelate desuccinylase [Minwuia sp.]|uniref:succinyl-diaminopimelate desuccinylase n=1 Tax=Minwuia sp. TaxID=2493630 RepID=UPI003A888343
MTDALELARDLIRCPSVTPEEGGALTCLEGALKPLGFTCHRLTFSDDDTPDVENLYARYGTEGPVFCFAGHTDVVPVGDADAWAFDPFGAEIHDGYLYGRGAVDMKTAIACMAEASARVIADGIDGSIAFLITGDEEGPAINGTVKVLDWMAENGERIDACLVGEPTNPMVLGEMAKIGRRGSFSGHLVVTGQQGHVAYPHLADNPLPRLVKMLDNIAGLQLDGGTDHFQPSNLEITTIDVGNAASNVIPARGEARFNVRYNTEQDAAGLEAKIRAACDSVGGYYTLTVRNSGDPFLTAPGDLTAMLEAAIGSELKVDPDLSTTGGTSDARFIKNACPVVEFGLISQTMHKVDECCAVENIPKLTAIYERVLRSFFSGT